MTSQVSSGVVDDAAARANSEACQQALSELLVQSAMRSSLREGALLHADDDEDVIDITEDDADGNAGVSQQITSSPSDTTSVRGNFDNAGGGMMTKQGPFLRMLAERQREKELLGRMGKVSSPPGPLLGEDQREMKFAANLNATPDLKKRGNAGSNRLKTPRTREPDADDCLKNCTPEAARWALNAIMRKASGLAPGPNFIVINDVNTKTVEGVPVPVPVDGKDKESSPSDHELNMQRAIDSLKWSMMTGLDAGASFDGAASTASLQPGSGGAGGKAGSTFHRSSRGAGGRFGAGSRGNKGKASTHSSGSAGLTDQGKSSVTSSVGGASNIQVKKKKAKKSAAQRKKKGTVPPRKSEESATAENGSAGTSSLPFSAVGESETSETEVVDSNSTKGRVSNSKDAVTTRTTSTAGAASATAVATTGEPKRDDEMKTNKAGTSSTSDTNTITTASTEGGRTGNEPWDEADHDDTASDTNSLRKSKQSQRQRKKLASTSKGLDLEQTLDSIANEFRKSRERISSAKSTTPVAGAGQAVVGVEQGESGKKSAAPPVTAGPSCSSPTETRNAAGGSRSGSTSVAEEPDLSEIPNAEELIQKALSGDKIAQALCKSNKALLAAIRFRKGAGKGAAR